MKKVIFLGLLMLSACTTLEVQRGAELKQEKVDQITHESSKGDVINLLGSPSAKSSYGDETWYYIYNKRERRVFGDDDVVAQEVLAISFNHDDIVKNVQTYDKDQAEKIQYSDDKTPTAGHEMTVLEQIMGNVGKFNPGNTMGSNPTQGHGSIPGQP